MNSPAEMHPRVFERRKAVFYCQLQYASPEDEGQALADWVSHYEGKLPRPENYRRKTVAHLRHLLRKIDRLIGLVDARRDRGEILSFELSAMYKRHREYIVKELHRRMMVKKA